MKKGTGLFLAVIMVLALAGCVGGQQASESKEEPDASEYAQALDVLTAVTDAYAENELFSCYGGDPEHAVMDAPGVYDIQKKEGLNAELGLPESEYDKIDDAASIVHMMNANTFTGAVYHLKDSADMDGFSEMLEEAILARQWVCGQPDMLIMIRAGDSYVIAAFGEAELVETFKTHALSEVSGAELITERPIV